MGYYTTFRGSVSIVPGFANSGKFKDFWKSTKNLHYFASLDEDYDTGNIVGFNFDDADSGKAYYLHEEVGMFLDWVEENTDSIVNGTIEGFGEDSTDIWRIRILDGLMINEKAKIVWPDGELVDSVY